ncbi:MAG: hypothetical protein J6038_00675 [Bacilli bacterium]|nr:hypothetical protein [Bacilli bacterium]
MKIREFSNGKNHYLVLENAPGLRLTLCNLGASLYEVSYRNTCMNIAPADLEAFETSLAYYGKAIGRIAGRVRNGRIDIAGKTVQMSTNEGKNTLHGGLSSFAFQLFSEKVEKKKGKTLVTYSYLSKEGEENMPGNLLFQVIYEIPEDAASFRVLFRGQSDRDCLLHPILHPYFNLGEEDIMDHTLYLRAHSYYEMDEEMIPVKAVSCTPLLDFSKAKRIGDGAEHPSFLHSAPWGYDYFYVLDDAKGPAAILESKNFQMEVHTDFPCLLIYADNFAKGVKLNNGLLEKKHAALAIECSEHPAGVKPNLLKKGETYQRYSEYIFHAK